MKGKGRGGIGSGGVKWDIWGGIMTDPIAILYLNFSLKERERLEA